MVPYPTKILTAFQRIGAATAAIGIAAAVVASRVTPKHEAGPLDKTRRMLHHVHEDVRTARMIAPSPALRDNLRKTEVARGQIAKMTGVSDRRSLRAFDEEICQAAQSAEVYLSTGIVFNAGFNEGSITILVSGITGSQHFSFASGTSQANIITALNSFRHVLRVSATTSVIDSNRIEFRSLGFSSSDFVGLKEVNGLTNDFIFRTASDSGALDQHKDFGRSLITLSAFRP